MGMTINTPITSRRQHHVEHGAVVREEDQITNSATVPKNMPMLDVLVR